MWRSGKLDYSGVACRINLAEIQFTILTLDALLKELDSRTLTRITTVNSEAIVLANEKPWFREAVSRGDTCFDGWLPWFVAKFRERQTRIELLPGSRTIWNLAEAAAKRDLRLFLLGGSQIGNLRSTDVLSKFGGKILGYSPPVSKDHISPETNQEIIRRISNYSPDVILVAFGMEKAVLWIDRNSDVLERLGVRFVMGIGGTLEMVSGLIRRAPDIVSNMGFEWLWRTAIEPSRIPRLMHTFRVIRYL
jgi:N-acetylglucosaminyldiphosphoundecaprenol N-acetyl-beta-D-mannosaminyltransferase